MHNVDFVTLSYNKPVDFSPSDKPTWKNIPADLFGQMYSTCLVSLI